MKKEHNILIRVTAALSGFTAGAVIATCVGLTRAMNTIETKVSEKKYKYEDIVDNWYDNLAYIGYNTGFEEYEYIVYWYEGDNAYYLGFSTALEPSEAIQYIEEHPHLWLGKGLPVS